MPRLYLVRHGRAAAGWDAERDPGLDAQGIQQAISAAEVLAPHGPLDIVSSPMRRCRETAAPLAARWDASPALESRISEIPSPTDDLAARGVWLRALMKGDWPSVDARIETWRQDVVAALLECREPKILFTHFIAINAAVGAALRETRVVVFRPDHASVTVLETDGKDLRLIALGREADTQVR